MAEMGFFGILVPEQYGGLGLGLVRVLHGDRGAGPGMDERGEHHRPRQRARSPASALDQREELLPRVARGEYLGAFALSEPDAGSDIASIRTRAERDGDEWVINGQKMWCTFADQADYLIVVARTTPYDPARRHAGIRSFYVPKERGTLPARHHRQRRSARSATTAGRRGSCRSTACGCRPTTCSARERRRAPTRRRAFESVSRGAVDRAGAHRGARRSGWPAARSRTRSPTASSAGSSIARSATSRRMRFKIAQMAAEIEACRAFMYQVAADADAGRSPSTTRPRWSSSSPARWPSG